MTFSWPTLAEIRDRIDCRVARRRNRRTQWHPQFAWRPLRLNSGKIAWLQRLMVRHAGEGGGFVLMNNPSARVSYNRKTMAEWALYELVILSNSPTTSIEETTNNM